MALREFNDAEGNLWRVWDTRPTSRVRGERQGGWLTFEHGTLRRRLTPIPEGWADVPDEELRRLCINARAQTRRKRLIE